MSNNPLSALTVEIMQCCLCPSGPNWSRDCICPVAANMEADMLDGSPIYMQDVRNMSHYSIEIERGYHV